MIHESASVHVAPGCGDVSVNMLRVSAALVVTVIVASWFEVGFVGVSDTLNANVYVERRMMVVSTTRIFRSSGG